MTQEVNLAAMTAEEKEQLYTSLSNERKETANSRREAYEQLRHNFVFDVFEKLQTVTDNVTGFRKWLDGESDAFAGIMKEYGQLRKDDQQSYTIVDGDMKLEIKSNKVKSFDERADMAASRLMEYLKKYVQTTERGTDDPMYQLAMTLLERNKQGDLDYKSISKLYELESKFDGEYGEIMQLFKESNTVYKTAINYYFHRRDKAGVWRRIEPSFCRL